MNLTERQKMLVYAALLYGQANVDNLNDAYEGDLIPQKHRTAPPGVPADAKPEFNREEFAPLLDAFAPSV